MTKNPDQIVARSESDAPWTPDDALQILSPQLHGEALERVLKAADVRMRNISGNRGRIWAAIGVNAAPCSCNCKFCSHGEAWGVYGQPYELSMAEVCERAKNLAQHNPDWLTLRFTQDFGITRICELARQVRKYLPVSTELVANTGEFSVEEAETLAHAGIAAIYHAYRLREGIDTGVSIEERVKTLAAIRDCPDLDLVALVEPVGPEHTDEELVEAAFRLKEYKVSHSGVMARVPVPGTPLAKLGRTAEDRIVRAVAMTRLISGPEVNAICVHPPIPGALLAGANTVVVECGAIPRDTAAGCAPWRGFDIPAAKQLLSNAGYVARESAATACAPIASTKPCCDCK